MTFAYNNIQVLHIEPTTNCNAACPQCARMDINYYDHAANKNELRLSKIKEIVPIDFISQLDKMFMCGNFGDPAAARDTLDIYEYFRKHNQQITLGMNTNGGLRSTPWWQRLAKIMHNNLDYVVFSIDGLEDTNHIYRVNVKWSKLIENAIAYIDAGGKAHWDMLIYEHNQHQVEDCKKLAKQLGFTRFRTKVSNRFVDRPVEYLKPPQNHNTQAVTNKINCHALNERSLYLSANGTFLPCCFFGVEIFKRNFQWPQDKNLQQLVQNFNSVCETWNTNPDKTCSKYCSESLVNTVFQNQWKSEESLN